MSHVREEGRVSGPVMAESDWKTLFQQFSCSDKVHSAPPAPCKSSTTSEESLASSDADDEESLQPFRKLIGKGRSFPRHLFTGILPQSTEKVPWDIDGTQLYVMNNVSELNLAKKLKTGRSFKFSSTTKKGFTGIWRNGTCQGNFICFNDECTKRICNPELRRNTSCWYHRDNEKHCFSCDHVMVRIPCGAHMHVELDTQTKELKVYHLGDHVCQPKPIAHEEDLQTSVDSHPFLSAKRVQKAAVSNLVDGGDISRVSNFLENSLKRILRN